MQAMLELAYRDGYPAVTIEGMLEEAGVSREDFDANFESKEDCAVAVLTELASSNLRSARAAYDREERWPDSLRSAAYATAEWMVANPAKVRFGAVDMLMAGEMTKAVREEFLHRLGLMIDGGRAVAENPEDVPASTPEAIIGTIVEMVGRRVQQGGGLGNPAEFVPEIMYLAVLPYLGEDAARRELEIPPPPPTEPQR
jgi:AcrR family transcriptional regulator